MAASNPRTVSSRRPFATATAALRSPATGQVRRGAALLPELLDLRGAIQVVDALQSGIARRASPPNAAAVIPRARSRLIAAEREARKPLDASVLSSARIARACERAGIPRTRSAKALARASDTLFAPLETAAQRRIATVRAMVGEARSELAPLIAASTEDAARLEQLDEALSVATASRIGALRERGFRAVAHAFETDLAEAALALPRGCSKLPAAEWSESFCAIAVVRCEALVLATYHHERQRLDLLVGSTLGALPERGPDA